MLDWLSLHGVNLPLAWVGAEKILIEVFQEIGLTDAEITSFLSGPPFQAWNRFGNIQGSWGGSLPRAWVNSQFDMQTKIVQRMVELGMTPVLPAFTGFVPRAITRVLPHANVVNGSQWEGFPIQYTNTTFLEPSDPSFTSLQKRFIEKQTEVYGNVTHIYTLDQYNENNPYSGALDYLRNVTLNTWKSLKAANPAAVWMMQGWLFTSNSAFWTNQRIEAYLSGVEVDSDMLILDLFSESQPQWQRTDSYFGKPWIWCELHDYGGNMGLYGQVENVTVNAAAALRNSSSLVGYGLTPEGQEGNEVMYQLLLDQAWSNTALNTDDYFHEWTQVRYAESGRVPREMYEAWDILRTTVYNNTNLTSNAVPKSILTLAPSITGLLGRTGHHPTTLHYNPADVVKAWSLLYSAANKNRALWNNPIFQYDLTDVTRQVLANAFITLYDTLIAAYHSSTASAKTIKQSGAPLLSLLSDLDTLLYTNPNFLLSTWIEDARYWAGNSASDASYYEYTARNQITLWGPDGEINDYASKEWAGLVGQYYRGRWEIFVEYLEGTPAAGYNSSALGADLLKFEEGWQTQTWGKGRDQPSGTVGQLQVVIRDISGRWQSVFGHQH